MKALLPELLMIVLIAVATLTACGPGNPKVLIKTERGDIEVEIFDRKAPVTAANFLAYVDQNRFESSSFYRSVRLDNQTDAVKIEVIQGGLGFAESGKRLPPIEHETTDRTGLRHLDGTLSMARAEPGTASSEFFICVGPQPALDFGGGRNPDGQGFAAFGKVIGGRNVVKEIHRQPTDGQMLRPEIKIETIIRMK